MDYGKLPNRTQPTLPSLYPVYNEISGRDIPSPLITSSTSTNSTWPPYDGDIVVARVASDLELSARNLPNAAVGMTFGAAPANPSIDSAQPRIQYNPSAEESQKADSGPNTSTGAETEKEKPRAYIACQTCRSRKVRCDGVRPVCTNCTKRHQDCVYDDAPRRRGPDKNPGTRQRGPKGTSVAKKRKKNEELAKGSSNTPPANSEFVDSQPTASAAIAQESLSSESLVHPPHPTEARQKRTAATAGLPGATVPDAEVQSWPPVPFPAYEMPPSMVSQNSIHLPGSHPVPDRSRPSVSGLLAPVLEPVRPRAPPPFLLELESTAAEIAVLPDSITDNTPLHIPSVRTPEDTVSVQNKYGLQPWYPEMPTGRLTQLETFLYSQGIYQTNELQHPDYAKPIPIPYARLRPGSLSHPPATIVTVGEETDEAIYGGSSSGRPRQNDISREPSLRFTQDTWWDVILWLYNPQDRARAVREVQADLHCFFRDSSSWVSFINVQLFFNLFHHPDHRKLMQPALVLSCLAYSSWSQGSEAEGGAVQRTKAAKLRDLAQSAFDASYNAGWVDVMLAQAAWVLSLYEVSCHPETTGAKMEASIVLLDNVIHVLGLTSIDADNPRAPVFTRHMVPALGRPGPYATSNPNTLQSTSTHPLLYRHSSSAQRYIQYQATTQPTPFDTYRQVTNPFRSSGCPCNTISLSNVPEAARSTPFWLMSPMWKADLSYAEIRKEESRRLVWSTLALVGGESGARVALQAPQINLHVAKPENYALLYPGEALYASSPAIDSAFSGKE
ncbi:hypothetical protein FRB99_006898 [Tulasnella sp. 403]|nr:hypothetical protein FRB99_006898 [Tulasnella sp. 403]